MSVEVIEPKEGSQAAIAKISLENDTIFTYFVMSSDGVVLLYLPTKLEDGLFFPMEDGYMLDVTDYIEDIEIIDRYPEGSPEYAEYSELMKSIYTFH